MLETRILQDEIRSFSTNAEIRVGENHIYIGGSLPIRSLSSPITDRKTGKKFRERIEPSAFKLALLSNKAHGYKTKLLKSHNYEREFEYESELEFDEINERELRFLFTLPKTQRNLELLEDVPKSNASFSFGFVAGTTREEPSKEAGIDYIRIIYSFQELREISILDKFTLPAYEKAKGFKSYDYQSAEKKAEKLVLNKNRESLCEQYDKKLQEIKEYIQKQRKNAFYRVGAEFKIPL